jgi:NADP-dependent alcohol dehydrogenase
MRRRARVEAALPIGTVLTLPATGSEANGAAVISRRAIQETLLQFAARVWDLRDGSEDARIDAAIAATRNFYESLGLKTHLSDYGVKPGTAVEVARRLGAKGMGKLGERGDITPAVVEKILRLAA